MIILAIPLHEQTLAACERILGPDHTYTPSSRNNLAAYRAGAPDSSCACCAYVRCAF